MKKNILITSHVVFLHGQGVYGPCYAISQYLKLKKVGHVLIQHPLYNNTRTLIDVYDGNNSTLYKSRLLRTALTRFLQLPFDFITTFGWVIKRPKVDLLIAVDPFNAVMGIFLKIIGKVDTLIFYTADYAFDRFENPILNRIYHLLDFTAYRNADYVWNVSSRITEVRRKQGLPDMKNRFLPNAPAVRDLLRFRKDERTPHSLVLIANFTPAIQYETIVYAVEVLVKDFPNLHVSFIGSGEREQAIKDLVKEKNLGSHFTFHGLKNHDDALEIMSTHEIGLALYDNKWPWTSFGDSLKAREYLALGLPVLINDHISTASDIEKYKAGFLLKVSTESITECITKLFSDKELLKQMQRNACLVAENYDLEKLLDNELQPLISP